MVMKLFLMDILTEEAWLEFKRIFKRFNITYIGKVVTKSTYFNLYVLKNDSRKFGKGLGSVYLLNV
jgi:hypothetical protein